MTGYTAFVSYILIPTSGTINSDYSQAIHCNYIKKLDLNTTNPDVQEISLNFPDINDFKFLAPNLTSSTGYTANKIHALVQVVDNTPFNSYDEIVPDSSAWKQLDITPQVNGYLSGSSVFLTASQLTSVVFKISLLQYDNPAVFLPYNLDYLNYPSSSQVNELAFGASTYFFGNVSTSIKADVYTTDISINLPLNEFNSSTNKTWIADEDETVYISEVGIYDSNKNLVAIGKLNDPVAKDGTIARTIVFALDF